MALQEKSFCAQRTCKELRANAEKKAAEETLRAQKREDRAARKLQEEEAKAQRATQRNSRRIRQLSDEGEVLGEFESLAEAERIIGVNRKSIREAATGKQKHAGGFRWEYVAVEQTLPEADMQSATPDGVADIIEI